MRLWSLHPKYLDSQGLVALWRESLLAKAVLDGKTQGYTRHPQLARFRSHAIPTLAINVYLLGIYGEASERGFAFDGSKIGPVNDGTTRMPVSSGQVEYEWNHLLAKLAARSPAVYTKLHSLQTPECHPIFYLCPGGIEDWERTANR